MNQSASALPFVIAPLSTTYQRKVTVRFILEEGGATEPRTFTAVYHRFDQARIDQLRIDYLRDKIPPSTLVYAFLAGWGTDVKGVDGAPLPFTRENLDALLNMNPAREALISDFWDSVNGGGRLGN